MFPVDAFRSTLAKAAHIFDWHSIRFHLTGGITTITYGEPRMTQDIDLVLDHAAISRCLDAFVQSLSQSDFLFDERVLRSSVDKQQMFQLLDTAESLN